MAIPRIMQGDTSAKIVFDVAEGWDYDGCVLRVGLAGVVKDVSGLVPGACAFVSYTAEETERMPLGTYHMTMRLVNPNGVVRSLPWSRVTVTSSPEEVYDIPHVTVDPSQLDVTEATAGDSLGAVKSKLNEIIAFLRGGPCVLALFACLSAFALSPSTELNDISGTNTVADIVNAGATNLATAAQLVTVSNVAESARQTATSAYNGLQGKQNALTPSQLSVLNNGPYATTSALAAKADEVSPWVAHSTSPDIESVIGGRVVVLEQVDYMGVMFWAALSDLAVEGYTSQWNLSDSPASDDDTTVRFSSYYLRDNQSYGFTVTRGRVLRTGDPSVSAAFDAWRTNDNQVALGNSSTVSASKGMAIGLKTTTGRTTVAAGVSSIAFGIGAQTAPAAAASVALGANATASAANAVQIGAGNNAAASTLKFMGTTVVDADGRIPLATHNAQVVDSISAVNAWQNYWSGDDVRVTVTNYYGSLDIPSLYLEQKMPADETHEDAWFKVVWDERTRWADFLAAWNEVTNNVADRAWGVYDSSSGEFSPDGLLQLSQEQIMIASGLAYQKTVTAGGSAIWVLKSTSPTMLTGQTEDGYFRIEDGDGNALFEIVKGDKRIVGATATGVSMSGTSMLITYAVDSAEHPTLEVCTDLRTNAWASETDTTAATVSWSGSSGNWVATVTPVGARPQLFAKASYEAGGETYIRNSAPISGGILCTDGVHKVRPVYNNGTITWTVVQ